MNYQDELSNRRRAALWRALRRHQPLDDTVMLSKEHQAEVTQYRENLPADDMGDVEPWVESEHQGKRADQVQLSLLVIAGLAGLGAWGIIVGVAVALWEALR